MVNYKSCHKTTCLNRGVAQFGRVLGLGPRCRRFESCHLDQMQNGLDAKFDAFKPFFCVLIFLAEDGFFSKMPTFSGMCQRKVPTEKNKGLRKAPCILVASVIFQSFLSITTLLKQSSMMPSALLRSLSKVSWYTFLYTSGVLQPPISMAYFSGTFSMAAVLAKICLQS